MKSLTMIMMKTTFLSPCWSCFTTFTRIGAIFTIVQINSERKNHGNQHSAPNCDKKQKKANEGRPSSSKLFVSNTHWVLCRRVHLLKVIHGLRCCHGLPSGLLPPGAHFHGKKCRFSWFHVEKGCYFENKQTQNYERLLSVKALTDQSSLRKGFYLLQRRESKQQTESVVYRASGALQRNQIPTTIHSRKAFILQKLTDQKVEIYSILCLNTAVLKNHD